MLANRYIKTSLEFETIAYKCSSFLNANFELANALSLKSAAEAFMCTTLKPTSRTLTKCFSTTSTTNLFSNRMEKSKTGHQCLAIQFRGVKKKIYTLGAINRDFKAFVYRTKQSEEYTCPAGWSLSSQTSSN